ncbi:Protein zwilch homolog [Anthophora plagiata]
MFDIETLRKILDPSIKIDKTNLSYVTRIFPEFKDTSCIILYKEHPPESLNDSSKCIYDNQTNQFDITGSPLKYTFREEADFEDTILLIKQNWYKGEEKYLPLSRTEACNVLNVCIEFINDTVPPIFALCDAKDNKKSRLLGTIIKGEWFSTIEVCSHGTEKFDTIKKSSDMFQQHLELSHACEHDINISAFSTFDLFGTREEMINWNDNIKNNFEGSLSVEVNTCSLSLYPPTRASKNNLVAQVVTNSRSSPLKGLWEQLLLLNQYLNIIEEYIKNIDSHYTSKPLEFPCDFTGPYKEDHDVVLKNINLLLNGDYSFRNPNSIEEQKVNFLNEENLENDVKIQQYIQGLPFRYNLDFTDFLWDLLILNSNYLEMTKCIYVVLEEIIVNACLPQVNFTNSTRFAKIITNPHQQTIISHLLSGSLPLEYIIDMGFEKLCKDYVYILRNARFGELHDIQQRLKNISSSEFSVDSYRKRLICLAQIHVCLEFMLLLEDNLECSSDDLRTLFSCAFRQYVGEKSPIKSYHDLHQSVIYTLSAPLPVSAVNNLNKEFPSVRRISLSTESKLSKLTTVRYYSQLPIFPTSIYPLDDSDAMDEEYYVTSAICSSNKFKQSSN